MKKIGEGYYYNVFEVTPDTVIKSIKSRFRVFIFILFANKFNISNTAKEYKVVISSIPKLKSIYSKVLSLISDKSLIGNPEFVNNVNYKQDRVKELKSINDLNKKEFIKVISDYTNLLRRLWSFKVSDSVFNFSINCGYNKHYELVLIDFNEMTFDKEKVNEQIVNKVWLQRTSYLRLTKEKQDLFNEIFNREITQKV